MNFHNVAQLLEYLKTIDPSTRIVQSDSSYGELEGYRPLRCPKMVLTTERGSIAKYWSEKEIEEYGPVFSALKFGE